MREIVTRLKEARDIERAKQIMESAGYTVTESTEIDESALDKFRELIMDDSVLDTMIKIGREIGVDTDSEPTEEEAKKLLDVYYGNVDSGKYASPARNDDSTREEKLAYCRELISKAREEGDADAAWDLVDFLWDTELLNESIKESAVADLKLDQESPKKSNQYMIFKKMYKNSKTFKCKYRQSGDLKDFIDKLEVNGTTYEIYDHATDTGCTVFY